MKIKFFIPLFFILTFLRGGMLEQKEAEITEAILKLEEGEEKITSEDIDRIIRLINNLEKQAREESVSSDNEDEEDEEGEENDIQVFQEWRMLLEALKEYIALPSDEMSKKLDEWGDYRPGDCKLIEKVKRQTPSPKKDPQEPAKKRARAEEKIKIEDSLVEQIIQLEKAILEMPAITPDAIDGFISKIEELYKKFIKEKETKGEKESNTTERYNDGEVKIVNLNNRMAVFLIILKEYVQQPSTKVLKELQTWACAMPEVSGLVKRAQKEVHKRTREEKPSQEPAKKRARKAIH